MEITLCRTHVFLSGARASKRVNRRWKMTRLTEGVRQTGCRIGMADKAWGLLADRKSAWYKNDLENCQQRFRHEESLCKNSTYSSEWWSDGELHTGVSGHEQVSTNFTRLASKNRHWWWDMDFRVQPENQEPEQPVQVLDVAKENKTS